MNGRPAGAFRSVQKCGNQKKVEFKGIGWRCDMVPVTWKLLQLYSDSRHYFVPVEKKIVVRGTYYVLTNLSWTLTYTIYLYKFIDPTSIQQKSQDISEVESGGTKLRYVQTPHDNATHGAMIEADNGPHFQIGCRPCCQASNSRRSRFSLPCRPP